MFKASIALFAFVAIFWSTAAQVQAQAQGEYIVMTPDKIPGWEAVGRVTFNRTGAGYTCTGTLVAPDKVLTAAHCVSLQFDKGPSAARHLIFQAGKSGTSVVEVKGVARISYHPGYAPGAGLRKNIPHDVAVLHLVAPMETVEPMPLAQVPDQMELVSYLAHRANGRNPPRLTEDCSHRLLTPSVLEVGCRAIQGNSGAGVIVEDDDGKRLVAVISAAAEVRFYAAIPDEWLFSILNGS